MITRDQDLKNRFGVALVAAAAAVFLLPAMAEARGYGTDSRESSMMQNDREMRYDTAHDNSRVRGQERYNQDRYSQQGYRNPAGYREGHQQPAYGSMRDHYREGARSDSYQLTNLAFNQQCANIPANEEKYEANELEALKDQCDMRAARVHTNHPNAADRTGGIGWSTLVR